MTSRWREQVPLPSAMRPCYTRWRTGRLREVPRGFQPLPSNRAAAREPPILGPTPGRTLLVTLHLNAELVKGEAEPTLRPRIWLKPSWRFASPARGVLFLALWSPARCLELPAPPSMRFRTYQCSGADHTVRRLLALEVEQRTPTGRDRIAGLRRSNTVVLSARLSGHVVFADGNRIYFRNLIN